MIKVTKLSKNYGEYSAVKEISFTADSGQVVGFLGPNGAGKTTTIRMLSTFIPPSSGTAIVAGYDVKKESDKVREKIGYLPETPPLYDDMTVKEYLVFVAKLKNVASKKVKVSVANSIERCFLQEVQNKLCGTLSKGYKQRVGLAQAIIHDPEVIILDEPTSGLDPKQIIEIRSLIKELGQNKTVLLSTHILPEVSSVCTKVVVVNKGRVVVEGTLSEITKERSLEQVFLESVNLEDSYASALA
jgi:ABC-2 type transport system ATP-binding protein